MGTQRNTNNYLIQSIIANVEDKARYCASVDNRETLCCFFDDHEIGLEPMKTTRAVVDRRSLGLPA